MSYMNGDIENLGNGNGNLDVGVEVEPPNMIPNG
jgi:hypothetical protein